MTLNIDFTPQATAWLNNQSQQQGLPPAEIVKKLINAQVAAAPTRSVPVRPALTAEQEAAIALLTSYLETESTDDPEEIRKAEEELEEFKRSMNANRETVFAPRACLTNTISTRSLSRPMSQMPGS